MKKLIVLLALVVLPGLAMATGKTTATKADDPATQAVASAMPSELTLTGATTENSSEIIKYATQAGANNPSFDPKTGTLKYEGTMDHAMFTTNVAKMLPKIGVHSKTVKP